MSITDSSTKLPRGSDTGASVSAQCRELRAAFICEEIELAVELIRAGDWAGAKLLILLALRSIETQEQSNHMAG